MHSWTPTSWHQHIYEQAASYPDQEKLLHVLAELNQLPPLVSIGEIWCQGHFPGRPIMPGVLVIESLMQLSAILAYASDPFDVTTSLMYFLGIEKAKFRRPVTPGDKLDLEVNVIQHRTNVWKFRGEACVDGSTAATAEFVASVVDREG